MVRYIKILIKIILIFLFFYLVVIAIENIFNVEVDSYMIYALFIIVASSMGWLTNNNKKN